MSHIARGVNRLDRGKSVGHLAIFEDGDVKRHESMWLKAACVRVLPNHVDRWQHAPVSTECKPDPVLKGSMMYLHRFSEKNSQAPRFYYEWYDTMDRALNVVRKALELTNDFWLFQPDGTLNPLNEEYLGQPYYRAVDLVPSIIVYDHRTKELPEDPRFKIHSGKYEDLKRFMDKHQAELEANNK